MVDEISIEGERYLGRFSIKQRTSEHDVYVDGEYAARWEKTKSSWWEGKGMVQDILTGSKERFQFSPKGNSQRDIIPYLNEQERIDKTKIDLALQSLYEQSRNSDEVYPSVNLELVVASAH